MVKNESVFSSGRSQAHQFFSGGDEEPASRQGQAFSQTWGRVENLRRAFKPPVSREFLHLETNKQKVIHGFILVKSISGQDG